MNSDYSIHCEVSNIVHPYMLQSRLKSREANTMPLDSSRELQTSADEDCGQWSLSAAAYSLGHLHVVGDTKTKPKISIEHDTATCNT